jgi:hypothetical protein
MRITEEFRDIFWELRINAAMHTENNGTVPVCMLRIATRFTKNVETAVRELDGWDVAQFSFYLNKVTINSKVAARREGFSLLYSLLVLNVMF